MALNAQRLRVSEVSFPHLATPPIGQLNLNAAHVGDLVDDTASWPLQPENLILDGFTYDRIDGGNNTSFAARRRWLEAGSTLNGEFRPQPYTQLAKVLRQMGHAGEARKVLCERERLLAQHRLEADRANTKRRSKATNGKGRCWLDMVAHEPCAGLVLGGPPHRGLRLRAAKGFYWAFGLFLFAALLAQLAWSSGAFAPNSDVILTSPAGRNRCQ